MISIASSPAGLAAAVTGTNCAPGNYTTPASLSWITGSSCQVSFSSTIPAGAGIRYIFSGWKDGAATNPRAFTAPVSATQYTASFSTQYQMNVSAAASNTGVVSAIPASVDGFRNSGSAVQITATPLPGYRFAQWSGDLSGVSVSQNTVVNRPVNAVANFVCDFAAGLSAQTIGMSGGSITGSIMSGAGCVWAAQSNAGWLTLSTGSGQGSGAFTVSAAPNTGAARSAGIVIAGQAFTITQTACAFVVSLSTQDAGAASAVIPASVTTGPGCMWTAQSNAAWLVLSAGNGQGSGTLSISVPANASGVRTGAVVIAGQTFSVGQAAFDGGIDSSVSVDSLSPFAGAATDQTFTMVYRDTAGWNDIASAYLVFNLSLETAGACYIRYNPATAQIRLYDDSGKVWLGPATPGSGAPVENTQCRVNASASSFSANGKTLTLRLALTFKPGFTGHKRIFAAAQNRAGASTLWLCYGGWWPGAGPSLPVNRYRLFNPFSRSHLHTTDLNEYITLGSRGFQQEGITGRVYNTPATVNGIDAVPLYRIYNQPGIRHFWTSDRNEYLSLINWLPDIYHGEGIDGFVFNTQIPGSIPMYRLVFKYEVIHHWTTDAYEYSVLGASGNWRQEGVAGYILAQ